MKRFLKFSYVMLLFMLDLNVCYAANVSLSANTFTVVKGNSVTARVSVSEESPIVSIEGNLVCSGAGVNKSISLNYDDSSNSVRSKSYSMSFTPSNSGKISCYTSKVRLTNMSSGNWVNVSDKQISITVNEPPKAVPKVYSSNNYLSGLSVNSLKLDKEFDKEVLEYTVTVPAGVEEITINAQLADSSASISGVGVKKVSEGVNTFEVVVTAENGSKRTYKLIANVLELEPIKVMIDKEEYTVVRKRKDLPKISEYNVEKVITIGSDSVEGYYNDSLKYDLVGLKNSKGEINYYIYNNLEYILYKEYTFNGMTLQIIDREVASGYKKTSFLYGGDEIDSYQEVTIDILKNTYALTDNSISGNQFYLFYAKNVETGKESLYQYDALEKTVQRYNLEVLDMINDAKDTYYMYLLCAILVLGIVIVIFSIILICKTKQKNNKFMIKHDIIEDEEVRAEDNGTCEVPIDMEEIENLDDEDNTSKKKKKKKKKKSREGKR